MRKTRSLSLTLLLPLFASAFCAAQTQATLTAAKISKIEALIRVEMAQSKIPGLSVAIVNGQQMSYAKGFGLADLEDAAPAKATTVYRLGSLSKAITAVAVMR